MSQHHNVNEHFVKRYVRSGEPSGNHLMLRISPRYNSKSNIKRRAIPRSLLTQLRTPPQPFTSNNLTLSDKKTFKQITFQNAVPHHHRPHPRSRILPVRNCCPKRYREHGPPSPRHIQHAQWHEVASNPRRHGRLHDPRETRNLRFCMPLWLRLLRQSGLSRQLSDQLVC